MKNIFKLLVAVFLLPVVSFAQDDISQSTGIIGNGRLLGARTIDGQTVVGILGIDSSGNTLVAALSGKTVYFQSIGGDDETVAGAGTTVANAAQLSATKNIHQITGADGTVGWKFSASTPIKSWQILLNTTAGVAKIYAESGGTVNGAAVDAAFSALTGIKPIICFKRAALTYICS